jgi:exonuclease III
MNMIELQKQFQPKARNICSACGKDIGVSKLVVVGNVNICFECADLSKQLADKERNEVAEKEIQQMANDLSTGDAGLIDMGMGTARAHAERLYKAGYRKVE